MTGAPPPVAQILAEVEWARGYPPAVPCGQTEPHDGHAHEITISPRVKIWRWCFGPEGNR